MCERESCQILNSTLNTTTNLANECKCQPANCNTTNYRKVHQSHHTITSHQVQQQTNVNMLHSQQQQQQQEIHHMQMSFSATASSNNSSGTTTSTSSTSDNSPISTSSSDNSRSSSCTSSSAPSASPSIGVNLRVTGQCSQGGRKYMEDYFSVAYQQSENAKDLEYAFIGIYDGHGGAEAATFAKEHLMMEIINQKLFWSDSDHDVLRAIREGYISTHYAMWRDQEKWPKTANGLPSTAGTTATIAFIRREKIYIGHVGDSGIVLGYQNENEKFWRAKPLTTDHKPESVEERSRIMRSGGKVVIKSGVPRVVWNRPRNGHKGPIRRNTPVDEIPFLAVARSLGDLWSYNSQRNEFVVSPDPDVKVVQINPKTFRCLIFGTDGLWNVVSAQEAVDTVYEKETINERLQVIRGESPADGAQWTNPSKGLVDRALKTWSSKKMRADNTSVVTVILYPPGNGSETCTNISSATNPMLVEQERQPAVPPNTYALEYTHVNTEIPTYDDATTYQEMAEKYMPPEEYRNFNFYDDGTEMEEEIKPMMSDESTANNAILQPMTTGDIMYWQNCTDKMYATNAVDSWDWNNVKSLDKPVVELAGMGNDENDEDNADQDDTNENVVNEKVALDTTIVEHQTANFEQYLTDNSTDVNVVTKTVASVDGTTYLNSFAESYNSLLTEQMSQESSTSNSNPANYQSISTSSMHEILQEQQLYQQQCMSEEEGYSLTKLETRREQQRCSGVQTFKIFQQHQQTSTATGTSTNYHQSTSGDNTSCTGELPQHFWDAARIPAVSGAINKYLSYQQQQQVQQPQTSTIASKPLELNSLLQQELEEEQQVALERLALQSQPADAAVDATDNSFACLQSQSEAIESIDVAEEAEETFVEEYLEEEFAHNSLHDETVQINEISSSSIMVDNDEPNTAPDMLTDVTPIVAPEVTGSHDTLIEQIEKIQVMRSKRSRFSVTPTPLKLKRCAPSLRFVCTSTPNASSSSTKTSKSCLNLTHAAKRAVQTHFPNIPNENQRLTAHSVSAHALKQSRRHTHFVPTVSVSVSCSTPTTASCATNTASCNLERRQLRSSACGLNVSDYSKRTLRTRNSLAKDMKAKTSLTSTLKRTASVGTQFLRKTASSLIANVTTQTEQLPPHATPTSSSSSNRNNIESIKNATKTLKIDAASLTHAINLRSRLVGPSTTTHSTTTLTPSNHAHVLNTVTTSTSTPVLRRENRNLRSLKSATKDSFCKSTRQQSSVSTLAAPPPSPKLLHSAAAMAAATRARSLLVAKHTNVVMSVFSKRSSLRSSGGGGVGTTSSTSNANPNPKTGMHSTTRSRSNGVTKKLKR